MILFLDYKLCTFYLSKHSTSTYETMSYLMAVEKWLWNLIGDDGGEKRSGQICEANLSLYPKEFTPALLPSSGLITIMPV